MRWVWLRLRSRKGFIYPEKIIGHYPIFENGLILLLKDLNNEIKISVIKDLEDMFDE